MHRPHECFHARSRTCPHALAHIPMHALALATAHTPCIWASLALDMHLDAAILMVQMSYKDYVYIFIYLFNKYSIMSS